MKQRDDADGVAGNQRTTHVMPWFAQARDAADGRLLLRHGRLDLDWDITRSEATIEAVVRTHQRLVQATIDSASEALRENRPTSARHVRRMTAG